MIPAAPRHCRSTLGGSPGSARIGVALLEGTIVLAVFLTIIFAMFDLGLAVMRQNSLAEAARRLARTAIVHGDLAPPEHAAWGPLPYSGTADDDHEIANAVRAGLVTMNPAEVSISVRWPDGDNRTSDRVIVAVEYAHRTILPSLLGGTSLELRAESTMRIEHQMVESGWSMVEGICPFTIGHPPSTRDESRGQRCNMNVAHIDPASRTRAPVRY